LPGYQSRLIGESTNSRLLVATGSNVSQRSGRPESVRSSNTDPWLAG
jgi:hypothetical protein